MRIFTAFLKNKNIIFKIRRSKVTDYAALTASNCSISLTVINPFQWKKYNVVQSDYFASLKHQYEQSVGRTDFFYTLSHLYLHEENKGRWYDLWFIMISGVRHIVLKKKKSMYNLEVRIILTIKLHLKCLRPVFAMIFTTSFFRNPYPDEKYSETSLPTSQNSSNIQDDDVTFVHRCTPSILSKAQI